MTLTQYILLHIAVFMFNPFALLWYASVIEYFKKELKKLNKML